MKNLLPFLVFVLLAGSVSAQKKAIRLPSRLQEISVLKPVAGEEPVLPLQSLSRFPASGNTSETVIGTTRYDLQTNTSCQNRFYLYPDGTIAGTWTFGVNDGNGYQERGTGYNYYDGTSWDPIPLFRIESLRTGWPSYAPWNAQGEAVVSHHFATFPALILTRPQKGTGSWSETEIPLPAGALGLDWPRMITSGPGNQCIHLIGLTTPIASGGAAYQGLDGAVVYYRSLDGGATWDIPGIILPQMTSADYLGFSADDYAWATPKGDTIAFVTGGHWTDTFIMVSYDNGTNWQKIPILNNGNKMVPSGTETGIFACCDGSLAIEKDADGVFHVVFGRMRAKGDLDGRKYYPWTDGLIYWNTNMEILNDSLDPDTLEAHGQLLGYVVENVTGDTIVGFPYYQVSLSSFPQISIDAEGLIFVIWSGITVGNPSPYDQNYRHIWSRASLDLGQTWGEMTDLNQGLLYIGREFVFPSMAKNTTENEVHFIYQTADIPGSSIRDNTVPVHDNAIEYRKETKETIIGISQSQKGVQPFFASCAPNPFHETTRILVSAGQTGIISCTVTNLIGQKVYQDCRELNNPGTVEFLLDGSSSSPGVYLFRIILNGNSLTGKLIRD